MCPWTDSVEVSAHTFPVDMITLEYSRVKATTVSMRLQIYSQSLKYPTRRAGSGVPGNRDLREASEGEGEADRRLHLGGDAGGEDDAGVGCH